MNLARSESLSKRVRFANPSNCVSRLSDGKYARRRRMSDASRRYMASKSFEKGSAFADEEDPEDYDELDPVVKGTPSVSDSEFWNSDSEWGESDEPSNEEQTKPLPITPRPGAKHSRASCTGTTFTTIGPATCGSRPRIRFRQSHQGGGAVQSVQYVAESHDGDLRDITPAEIAILREEATTPQIYFRNTNATADWSNYDLIMPYHRAWEICR